MAMSGSSATAKSDSDADNLCKAGGGSAKHMRAADRCSHCFEVRSAAPHLTRAALARARVPSAPPSPFRCSCPAAPAAALSVPSASPPAASPSMTPRAPSSFSPLSSGASSSLPSEACASSSSSSLASASRLARRTAAPRRRRQKISSGEMLPLPLSARSVALSERSEGGHAAKTCAMLMQKAAAFPPA
eukprot:scaffold125559_cov66-Phaeocystis_antarctica.AAC.1